MASISGNSNLTILPCLICNGKSEDKCQFSSSSKSKSFLISEQLDTIFVLRRILEVPYELLEGFFSNGEHPSEWGIVSMCNKCGEEINKCKGLFEEMSRFQRRFEEKKEEIIEMVKRRHAAAPRKRCKINGKFGLREKCLRFVVKNNYTKLTNPFAGGDLKAIELQAIVKQEMEEVDLEEIGGDFEVLEVDFIVPSDLEKEEDADDHDIYKEEMEVTNEEISSDSSDYKPKSEENFQKVKVKKKLSQSLSSSSPPKLIKKTRKRGRSPLENEATTDFESEPIREKRRKVKLTFRPKQKQGLLPPPPPPNPDPSTLITCPNCHLSKFPKSRGDLLYTHLINECLNKVPPFKAFDTMASWTCQLCKNEVPSSSSTPSEYCLRFVEHLNSCQAPDSQEIPDSGPYPLSSRLFQCDLCYPLQPGSPVFTFPHFLDHCIFHKKYTYQCTHPQCPPTCRFSTMNYLRYHWRHHHPSPSIIPFSHTITSTLPTLQFYCSHCHLHFPSETHLSSHLISSHPNIPPIPSTTSLHTCLYCSKAYPSPSLLSLHEIAIHLHQKYFLQCPICLTYHPSPKSLALHQKSRLHQAFLQDNPIGGDSQICEICGVICKDTSLQTHLKIYHPAKKVRPLRTGRPPSLAKVDAKGRSLECPQCKKYFSQLTNLNLHVRTIHEGNWPFYCHSCGKGLPSKTTLKRHLAVAHGEGTYGQMTCQIDGCGKIFVAKDLLQNHLNRHRGEKGFGCEYCGKAFFGKKNLQRHLLIHTNPDDKPFECKVCPHKFRISGHLKMHMNLHKKKGEC